MNYEELLEARNDVRNKKYWLPIGDYYRQQTDGKWRGTVDVRKELHESITFSKALEEEAEKIDRIPLGMFGFYTDDPKVFEQRVTEMEADMDEIDAGIEDPEKWISSEQMWTELYERHPWLR